MKGTVSQDIYTFILIFVSYVICLIFATVDCGFTMYTTTEYFPSNFI